MNGKLLLIVSSIAYCGTLINADFVIGCYFTNWSQHRKEQVKYLPKDIDPSLCTHAYFAFANIDLDTMSITSFEENDVADGSNRPVSFQ